MLLWVTTVALLCRLLYLSEHARSPFFGFPVLDELYYDTVARLLVAGDSLAEINPGFRPLLYPWLLSLVYHPSLEWGPVWAVVLQHLLGIGTALLVVLLAYRLSASDRAALVAGLLYALAGPPLFFEGELLIASLMAFLAVALVLLLSHLRLGHLDRAPAGRAVIAWGTAGGALAVAAQARPNALLVALAFPLAALLFAGASLARRLLLPACALGGLAIGLGLVAWIQRPHFGALQLTTGAGGVNFYLGNKRGADGMVPRQDRAVTYGNVYRDSVQVFAREEYAAAHGVPPATASAEEISRFWLRRGLDEIAAAPGDWLRLMVRKLWLLTWSYEIPNNKTYAFVAREESKLLRWLPVRWWLLFAFAPVGAVAVARHGDRDSLFWLLAFVGLWSLGLALFFVNSRYRIPLWPLLAPLAAAGGTALCEAGRRGDWGTVLRGAALAAAAALVSLVNWAGIERPNMSRDYFFRSLAHLERGNLEEAGEDARRALELEPREPAYLFQLAAVALREERFDDAERALRAAAALKPGEPRVWNSLGVALEGQRRYGEAYDSYRQALEQVGDYAPALVNAGLLALRAGLVEPAAEHLERAVQTGEETVQLLCAQALLAAAQGRSPLSDRLLARAREQSPELVERLLAESRHAVELSSPEAAR